MNNSPENRNLTKVGGKGLLGELAEANLMFAHCNGVVMPVLLTESRLWPSFKDLRDLFVLRFKLESLDF